MSFSREEIERRKKLWQNWQQKLSPDAFNALQSELPELAVADKSDEKLYGQEIKFGTSGVREMIGSGFSLINHSTIFAITKGIAKLLHENCSEQLSKNGVIVGYDGRRFSKEFAHLVATIFKCHEGVGNVRVFSKVVPTPTLAYSSKYFGCALGVMITASHNSKEYNGYKIYDSNGCFITPPLDSKMVEYINNYLADAAPEDCDQVVASLKTSIYEDPYDLIKKNFLKDILDQCATLPVSIAKDHVGICYSAMHGCGEDFVSSLLQQANFKKYCSVAEQAEPDEMFSTVKDPNPEVGYPTLRLACETADSNGYTVALVNDPDADRLAMVEKIDNEWKIYTGNQMAMVLVDYLLKSKSTDEIKKCCIYYSTVSSSFSKTLQKSLNFEAGETLTGFKFLGECMRKAKSDGKIPLLAFEESLGFLCGTHVYDKDGVSGALVFSEIAEHCYKNNMTINGYLTSLMEKYGYHITYNKYYKISDMSVVPSVFDSIRYYKPGKEKSLDSYPTKLGNGKYTVEGVRDLTIGFDSTQPNNEPILPVSKSNQMITFYTKEKLVLTVRGSGTEPKLKFYLEKVYDGNILSQGKFSNEAQLVEDMRSDAILIMDEMLNPSKFGLSRSF